MPESYVTMLSQYAIRYRDLKHLICSISYKGTESFAYHRVNKTHQNTLLKPVRAIIKTRLKGNGNLSVHGQL